MLSLTARSVRGGVGFSAARTARGIELQIDVPEDCGGELRERSGRLPLVSGRNQFCLPPAEVE